MVKKLLAVTIVSVAAFIVVVGGKKDDSSSNNAGTDVKIQQSDSVSDNISENDAAEAVTTIEFSIVEDGCYSTTAQVDKFLAEVKTEFEDKIDRIWVNGWQDESGVQGSTVDDEVIYRTIGGRARNAYITNSFEDIVDMWEAGEKVVIVGQNLVTDETTYKIGDEEYRIVGIYGEGPMENHIALPLAAYPELDTIDAVCIMFSEPVSEAEMEQLDKASQDAFGGKISIK